MSIDFREYLTLFFLKIVYKTMISFTDKIHPLTRNSPLNMFHSIAHDYGSVWLDSSMTFDDRGRYSYIARNPMLDIKEVNGKIIINKSAESLKIKNNLSIFDLINELSQDKKLFIIGHINYEATLPFLGIKDIVKNDILPTQHFLVYKSVLRYDHTTQTYESTNQECDNYHDLTSKKLPKINKKVKYYKFSDSRLIYSLQKDAYLQKIHIIKNHIKEGDIYQANFTTRFDIKHSETPFSIYCRLRALNPSPYGCFMNLGSYHILSSSPERMFLKNRRHISSSPIKGTISRGNTFKKEKENLHTLLNSSKDKAELLMITDLIRNDLGKIADFGSVKVESLFKPEVYSSLIHLVSDISATVDEEINISEILKALLPGGSITGAPKKRAVEIINNTENKPRGVYTGNIGYINGDRADFNIAIRTMVAVNNIYHIHAGGGIVADSCPESEYDEMMLKAKNLFYALGMRL